MLSAASWTEGRLGARAVHANTEGDDEEIEEDKPYSTPLQIFWDMKTMENVV